MEWDPDADRRATALIQPTSQGSLDGADLPTMQGEYIPDWNETSAAALIGTVLRQG